MKTAIAGSWVYALVLIFMVVMIAYVAVTINYARTFEMSADVVKFIEEGEGYNDTTQQRINTYLRGNNQTAKHKCDMNTLNMDCTIGWDGNNWHRVNEGDTTKYDYCLSRTVDEVAGKKTTYYQLSLFFNFSIPILGDLWAFNVPIETAGMTYVTDPVFTSFGC